MTISRPVKCKLTTAGGQRKKSWYTSGGRFERFLLLVFASWVDVEGEMFFDEKRIIKIKECQAISFFFAVECLAEVVVEKKKKPFYCNPFRPVWSVVKTKVESC